MRLHTLVPLTLLALTAPQGARAQSTPSSVDDSTGGSREDAGPVRHYLFNVGIGLSTPISNAGDRFKMGGGFEVGVGFQFLRWLGVTASYLYTEYDVQGDVLAATRLDGSHSMHYGALNAVVDVLPRSRFGLYFIGGPGLYYRNVEISQLAGTDTVSFCDPWLLICTTNEVPVSNVIGTRSSTDLGLAAGLGITFDIFDDLRLYLEARYHYIFGPEFTAQDGTLRKADGQYIPIMFGLRY